MQINDDSIRYGAVISDYNNTVCVARAALINLVVPAVAPFSNKHASSFIFFRLDILCVAGFYCQAGTVTSDPFRNDTTLRPYPCSPGSYCLGGVGYAEVRSGDYHYAQTCPAGFFCETARYNGVPLSPFEIVYAKEALRKDRQHDDY